MRFLTFDSRQEFLDALQDADLICDELSIVVKYGQPLPPDLVPQDHHWVPLYDTHTCERHIQRLLSENIRLQKELTSVKSRLLLLITNQIPA
jgi:hypothetical protein